MQVVTYTNLFFFFMSTSFECDITDSKDVTQLRQTPVLEYQWRLKCMFF